METWKDRIYLLFLFWFVVGVVLVGFDLLPEWLEWANSVFLVLAGIIGVFYFYSIFNSTKATLVVIVIYVFSSFMEYLGSAYGILFGNYDYTDRFGYKLFGLIPFTIGFAWLLVMATTHAVAKRITPHSGIGYLLVGSAAAVVMDLIIDPVAYKAKEYWIWQDGGWYYDIPWTNFMGWFVVAFLLHAVIWGVEKKDEYQTTYVKWKRRTYYLYAMMIGMFVVTAASAGLWFSVFITLVLTGCLYILAERRKRHDQSQQKKNI